MAFVQVTNKAGKIKVTASVVVYGKMRPLDAVLEFTSLPNQQKEIYSGKKCQQMSNETNNQTGIVVKSDLERENKLLRKRLNQMKVKEVEQ